jgi:hypothetical protein
MIGLALSGTGRLFSHANPGREIGNAIGNLQSFTIANSVSQCACQRHGPVTFAYGVVQKCYRNCRCVRICARSAIGNFRPSSESQTARRIRWPASTTAPIKVESACKKLRHHNHFSVVDTRRMRTAAGRVVHIENVHDQCAAANVLSSGFDPDTQPKMPPWALIMARPIS